MGIQIHIKTKHMLQAGWEHVPKTRSYWEYQSDDDEGVERYYVVSTFRKGDVCLESYTDGGFFADCNAWGTNRQLFKDLELMDIPHTLS